MGNTLIKGDDDKNINDSLLGKEVTRIFTNQEQTIKTGNKEFKIPINKARACCLDVVKEKPKLNDFVTIELPVALDDKNIYCRTKKRCIGETKLGLKIKGDKEKICKIKYPSGMKEFSTAIGNYLCNEFMVDQCAKSLYDHGCIKCDNKKIGSDGFNTCTPKWNVKNKNCFTKDGTLIYGPEECACINSQTGFTLNRNPSSTIVSDGYGINDNPWGIKGSSNNNYTKYSLNLFDYDIAQQKPQVFDSRCGATMNDGSAKSGKSKAYLLPDYQGDVSICMNMIKLGGNSSFGETQLSNIQQSNNCGGGSGPDIWKDFEKTKKQKEKEEKDNGNRIETPESDKSKGTTEDKAEDKTKDKTEDKTEDETKDKTEDKTEDKSKDKTEDETKDKTEDKTEDETKDKTEDKTEDKTNNEETKISLNKKQLIIIGVGAFVFLIILILLLSGSSSSDQIKKE